MACVTIPAQMKTLYFTPETIQQKSKEIYQQVEKSSKKKALQMDPQRSALIVLDMQAYFLDPSSHAYVPSAGAIIPGLLALTDAYVQHGLPVIFTQHLNTIQDAGLMSTWWREVITEENPLSAIIPTFDLSVGSLVQKSQYDAFHQTGLEPLLRAKSVLQVVICGVMTHLCCETTARSAFMRGFEVYFAVDGTATYNEEHHRASVLNLTHGFATPVLVEQILLRLGEHE